MDFEEIPRDKWTKGQQEFVGRKFETPKGGVLTVIGVSNSNSSNKRFICSCSICSEDYELWPRGSISTFKSFLESGTAPCGCTRTPRWSKYQYRVRIEKCCKERDYSFVGFVGEWKGKDTKLHLKDKRTGEEWKSSTIHMILNQNSGNPYEDKRVKLSGINTRKYYDNSEELLSISNYPKGSSFKLLKGDCWEVSCSICSADIYSHIDGGKFNTRLPAILQGSLSCRCSKRYLWSRKEREVQVSYLLSKDGGSFIDWVEENCYTNSYSKFWWKCCRGHTTTSTINSIVSGRRCTHCKKEDMVKRGWANGFMPDRVNANDNLYILNFNNIYGKVGRALDVNKRIMKSGDGLSELSGVSPDNIEVCYIFSGTHEEVFWVEQQVLTRLRREGLIESRYKWSTELFKEGLQGYVRDCTAKLGLLSEISLQ